MGISDLPAVNASLNALSAVWLALGYVSIRRGQKTTHRNCMIGALASSTLFLASYLVYHFSIGAVTKFQGAGWVRALYFFILITHVILAAVILPLVLATVYRAVRSQFDDHKHLARWTWPLWMYVSVTGVAVYVMLYHLYPGR